MRLGDRLGVCPKPGTWPTGLCGFARALPQLSEGLCPEPRQPQQVWSFCVGICSDFSQCILRNPTSGVPPRFPPCTPSGQVQATSRWKEGSGRDTSQPGPLQLALPGGAPSSLPEFCLLLPQLQLEVWTSQAGELK